MKWKLLILGLVFLSMFSCTSTRPAKTTTLKADTSEATVTITNPGASTKTDRLLEDLLQSHPEYFADIICKKDSFNVQIIYTQINRQANNEPVFKNYYFNVNPQKYFYPASTVKMPVALMALQRL